ncbi:MAG: cell division protein FtsZ [Candidatus Brennerbacteria bacterium RIFOXYD1_FULL_41_16]|uniref:Cell division protein FtsZ n=1 Tax=Candidatus Brennerbacteria bacterium RIFOXYD1_FULL_41_16 TaxID=1797529 RepID=A0A1G1XL29_9BACT|nr:MAG: cell division protein FtsZ [Candidatus Brennerbacteria bacterium RIFOXYD1_FULL_41_16]
MKKIKKIKSKSRLIKKTAKTRAIRIDANVDFQAKAAFSVPKIKIIGVGGAGGNALSRIESIMPSIETIAFNTDIQDLRGCKAKKKIQIGKEATRGRGSGMDPDLGRHSAEENKEEILKSLEGAEIVFLTCGLGGGTGSGASPVVAECAQSLGAIVVAVVTMPFSFEGKEREQVAYRAHQKLLEKVDALVTVPNDRVFNIIDTNTSLKKAFWQIDEILREGIQAIHDLVVKPGLNNVDFADLKAIIKNSGEALLGIGFGDGKDRAIKAAQKAIQSPLLDITINNAKGVLFNVSAKDDLTMIELQQAAKTITELVSPEAKIIFGTSFDSRLSKGKMKITVVATGFNKDKETHSALPFDYSQSNYSSFDKTQGGQGRSFGYSQDRKSGVEEKDSEISSHAKDVLKEKIKPFESLEDEPAFLRKKK